MTEATYKPLAADLSEWTKANEDIPEHRRVSLASSIELVDSMVDLSGVPDAQPILRGTIQVVASMPKGAADIISILVTLLATAENERKSAYDEFNALSEEQRAGVKDAVGSVVKS